MTAISITSRSGTEPSIAAQRHILDRTDGVELELQVEPQAADTEVDAQAGSESQTLNVFTPHRDAVAQARFVLLSPRHPDIEGWVSDPTVAEQLDDLRSGGWERSARDASTVAVIDTGRSGDRARRHERPGLHLPAGYTPGYGPTAVLGIPAVDEADEVVAARVERLPAGASAADSEDGAAVDAAAITPISGGASPEVREAKRYRAFDFSISRQRYWGTPIPVIHCERCGAVPVPVEELPVRLPVDVLPTGEGNPLAERSDFVDVPCPKCGGDAKRETDTLDCHFDALWLWCPPRSSPEARDEEMFSHPALRQWLPSERLVAGNDSGGFVFDQRVVTKALRDIGSFSSSAMASLLPAASSTRWSSPGTAR